MQEYESFLSIHLQKDLLQQWVKISQTALAAYVTHRHPLSLTDSINRKR